MFDVPLKDIIDLVLKVDVGAYSFEAANPRHEHEWQRVEGREAAGGQGADAGRSSRTRPTSSSIPSWWPSGCCASPTASGATT